MIYKILKIFARILRPFLLKQAGFLEEMCDFVYFKRGLIVTKLELAAKNLLESNDNPAKEKVVFSIKLKIFFDRLAIICKIPSFLFEAFYVELLFKLLQIIRLCGLLTLTIAQTLIKLLDSLKVEKPPGSKLLAAANFFFKEQTVKGVFEQIVCDWRNEHYKALAEKRLIKARWVTIRGHWEFYCAAYKQSPIGDLIEEIRKFIK